MSLRCYASPRTPSTGALRYHSYLYTLTPLLSSKMRALFQVGGAGSGLRKASTAMSAIVCSCAVRLRAGGQRPRIAGRGREPQNGLATATEMRGILCHPPVLFNTHGVPKLHPPEKLMPWLITKP